MTVDILMSLGVDPIQATRFTRGLYKDKPTVTEAYGRGSIVQAANTTCRNLNITGLSATDLRTFKASGEPWDFSKAADRELARQKQREEKPDWLVGSPPCTAFLQVDELELP